MQESAHLRKIFHLDKQLKSDQSFGLPKIGSSHRSPGSPSLQFQEAFVKRLVLVLALFFVLPFQQVWADSFRLGNPQLVPSGIGAPGGTFANGTFTSAGSIPTSTAPFGGNNHCGGDSNLASVGNCNTSWTFNYSAYTSVTSASITLGLIGLDSANAGNQVASFMLTNGGGFDFTAAFNLQSENTNISGRASCVVNGNTVNNCPEYNIYQIAITDSNALAALESGSATFDFTMAGPGTGAFGSTTTYNGATLDFSELDITGTAAPTPEPSSITLLVSGAGFAGLARRWLRR